MGLENFKRKRESIKNNVEEGLKDYWAPETKNKDEMTKEGNGGITIEGIKLIKLSENERRELVDAIIKNNAEIFEVEPDFSEDERTNINQDGFKKIIIGDREIFLDINYGTLTNASFYERVDGELVGQRKGGYTGISVYKNEEGTEVANIGTPYFAESDYITTLSESAKMNGTNVRVDENDGVLPEFDKNKNH